MDRRLAPKWNTKLRPMRIYPNLSERYEHENREHLNRMRFFLDDLIMPFVDETIEFLGVKVKAKYDFIQHPFERVGEERPYVIKLELTRNGRGYCREFSMHNYEYMKSPDAPEQLEEWEKWMQAQISMAFQEMFFNLLDDYKKEKKAKMPVFHKGQFEEKEEK